MLVAAIGIAIIACVGFWMVGGVLLRSAGLVVAVLAALNLALVGNPAAMTTVTWAKLVGAQTKR